MLKKQELRRPQADYANANVKRGQCESHSQSDENTASPVSGGSRTSKNLKNSQVGILFYLLNLVLGFFSRQVFIEHLGAELLGLNTTALNLLGFLNLAELGIGAAVSFSLYKPLAAGDHKTVGEIVSVQGWLYRRIAWLVIGGSAVLMCFFPWIFAKADVDPWFPYLTFGVLLFGALAGYFVNYRQVVVSADQHEWRLTGVVQGTKNTKVLAQIAAIVLLPHGYVWWLVLEFVGSAATVWFTERCVRKHYPWLRTNVKEGGLLRKKYPQIAEKTKQVFVHKMAGFVLLQTSPLIIYGFTSLTMVAIYGNYMFLLTGIYSLLFAMLNGIVPGVGNLLLEGDKGRTMSFFCELFSLRFLLAAAACVGMWMLAPAFIELWVGPQYLMDKVSLGLMTGILYVMIVRGAVEAFTTAAGMFRDTWAPAVEAVINIGASIFLGWMYGLPGILAGVLLSLLIIVKGWKPLFLFRDYFHEPYGVYARMYGRHIAALAAALAVFVPLMMVVHINPAASWGSWALYAFIAVGGFMALLGAAMLLLTQGMKDLVARVRGILSNFAR